MLITNHFSHRWHGFAEPGETHILAYLKQRQAPVAQSLSECKESQKAMWIPEKFSPTVSKRPVTYERKSQTKNSKETPLGWWKFATHTLYKGNNCIYGWCTCIRRRIFASFFKHKRGGHDILWTVLYLFSFSSDFGCKYVITVNASNAYMISKTAQNCSYCICWSIITNVMQRQVSCQCFSLGHFTFTQTPTV